MKKHIFLFIFFTAALPVFLEEIDWETFFNEAIYDSMLGSYSKITDTSLHFENAFAKLKWFPSVSFNFPKVLSWKKINPLLTGTNNSNLHNKNYIDFLTGSYSVSLKQNLPANGDITIYSNFNFDYIPDSKEVKQTPSFGFVFNQPIAANTFNFFNESRKISAVLKNNHVRKIKNNLTFVKEYTNALFELEILYAECEHDTANYTFCHELYKIAEVDYKNGSIKKISLLSAQQKMISAKQKLDLTVNMFALKKYAFLANYNTEFTVISDESKNALIAYLEKLFLKNEDYDIHLLEYDALALHLEKENIKLKYAPKISIGFSMEPDGTKNILAANYVQSWKNLKLKNHIWVPEVFIGFSWSPDYLYIAKKELQFIDAKIKYTHKKIAAAKLQKSTGDLIKQKRISALKSDIQIIFENKNLQKQLLAEYKILFDKREITYAEILEAEMSFTLQHVLYIKKIAELSSYVMLF